VPTWSVLSGVDPCITNNGGCSADATCTFIAGNKTCTCKTGFTGNGNTCISEWVVRTLRTVAAMQEGARELVYVC